MFLRLLISCLLCLAAQTGAGAAVPELSLAHADAQINLSERMLSQRIPLDQAVDPDQLWLGAQGQAVEAAPRWQSTAGERMVGRITLTGTRERDTYVVQVPLSAVDEVQLWYREQGSGWKSAIAGDRIALSRWPFAGQYPALPILVRELPVDLIVTMANDGVVRTPIWIMADPIYREIQTRQSNLSGLVMGLGLMVTVVTILAALTLRGLANWLLAALAAWILITVMCLNGYMAVWLTPEWPRFNDGGKHFASVVLAGLLVAVTAHALDQRYLTRGEKLLKLAAPLSSIVYGAIQWLWLPGFWRPPGALVWSIMTLVAALVLCGRNALHGGRYVRWIAAAVACFGVAVLLVYARLDYVAGLDLRSAAVGSLLFASCLLFRQALFSRERYGRDVLGRAAIAASRDPLTALLSFQGFQTAYDEALLKQGAGQGQSAVMLFWLPGLDRSGADHGFVLTERAIVRFAASLQATLGDAWSIGRLSKTRFACISTGAAAQKDVQALATQVLTVCTRQADPIGPVSDFDLKIACTQRRLAGADLKALLVELEEAARLLEPPRRIVLV